MSSDLSKACGSAAGTSSPLSPPAPPPPRVVLPPQGIFPAGSDLGWPGSMTCVPRNGHTGARGSRSGAAAGSGSGEYGERQPGRGPRTTPVRVAGPLGPLLVRLFQGGISLEYLRGTPLRLEVFSDFVSKDARAGTAGAAWVPAHRPGTVTVAFPCRVVERWKMLTGLN